MSHDNDKNNKRTSADYFTLLYRYVMIPLLCRFMLVGGKRANIYFIILLRSIIMKDFKKNFI